MKFLPLILLACLSGCGAIVTYYPNGQVETAEITFAKDITLAKYTSDGKGNRTIDGGVSKSNERVTSAVVEGAVTAVLKSFNPLK